MNVWKRAVFYISRKIGKSIILFLILLLITTIITVGFSMLNAIQESAVNLRKNVGASFYIQGKIDELNFNESGTDYTTKSTFLTIQNINAIMEDSRIKTYNAVQSSTAYAYDLYTISGKEECPISANTETDWNSYFSTKTVFLTEGNPITSDNSMSAIISNELAMENNLTVNSELVLYSNTNRSPKEQVKLKVVALYENDPNMEFNTDTIFITHDAYWKLTDNMVETYSGKVNFIIDDPLEIDDVIEKVKQIKNINWDDYVFLKNSENYESISYQLSTMERLTVILITVSIIVSVSILFLVLVMRIRNRINEIGVMIAIGISKRNIVIQYIIEVEILLLLSIIVSYFINISVVMGLTSYMQNIVNDVVITISPNIVILQYLSEIIITVITIFMVTMPIIRLNPRDILSKMS